MRLTRRSSLAALAALLTRTARAEAEAGTGLLAPGTRFSTPWFRVVGDEPGPTVAIIAGIHGNETAPPAAADLLTRSHLRRGSLWVVPEANRPALAATSRFTPNARSSNLHRNFPTSCSPP